MWQGCNQFALKQISNTCYMASANLIALRLFEKDVRDLQVRHYMAELASKGRCPRPPKNVVDAYALEYSRVGLSHPRLKTGGDPAAWLSALLKTGGIRTALYVHRDGDSGEFFKRITKRGPRQPCEGRPCSAIVVRYSGPMEAVEYLFSTPPENARWIPSALLLYLTGRDRRHAVSVFPCNEAGSKYVLCNSWGDSCANGSSIESLVLSAVPGYHVQEIVIVFKSVTGAGPH